MHGGRSDGADGRGGHLRLIIVAVSQAYVNQRGATHEVTWFKTLGSPL